MPVLTNTRHEAFAQNLATGMSRDQAYEKAGYKPDRKNAHRLTTKDDVKTRIAELQGEIAEKAEWSAAERLLMLKGIALANRDADARVSVSAIAEANKMQGSHAASKHHHSGPNGGPIPIDLSNATDEQLEALAAVFGPLASGPDDDDEGDSGGEGQA